MEKHTIENRFIALSAIELGATLHQVWVKDKNDVSQNIILGFEDTQQYADNPFSIGATIGRYAGRISGGGFHINHKRFELYQEDGVHLHGGHVGFGQLMWTLESKTESEIIFTILSPDGQEGYPGNVEVKAEYRLLENGFEIVYSAKTDAPTYLNLTNHAYYNLAGKGHILNHSLKLNSQSYLETDAKLLPSGKLLSVSATPLDFMSNRAIGAHQAFKGIDDCFLLNKETDLAAELFASETGIRMQVHTNQPAVVVFTPPDFQKQNNLFENRYDRFSSICFETQYPPDAPNCNQFPSPLLLPGQLYVNKTQFLFSVEN
ncbi:MAG: galactose mutarotase [Bacteroidetes bacterium]|nr:galactose mutarotase [Bacteroidota bacterium]